MTEPITNISGTFTAGDDWSFTMTLEIGTTAQDVTGGTVTATLSQNNVPVLSDISCTLTTPADGIISFTVSSADSAKFATGIVTGDIKAVVSSTTTHYGPYTLNVRAAIT